MGATACRRRSLPTPRPRWQTPGNCRRRASCPRTAGIRLVEECLPPPCLNYPVAKDGQSERCLCLHVGRAHRSSRAASVEVRAANTSQARRGRTVAAAALADRWCMPWLRPRASNIGIPPPGKDTETNIVLCLSCNVGIANSVGYRDEMPVCCSPCSASNTPAVQAPWPADGGALPSGSRPGQFCLARPPRAFARFLWGFVEAELGVQWSEPVSSRMRRDRKKNRKQMIPIGPGGGCVCYTTASRIRAPLNAEILVCHTSPSSSHMAASSMAEYAWAFQASNTQLTLSLAFGRPGSQESPDWSSHGESVPAPSSRRRRP